MAYLPFDPTTDFHEYRIDLIPNNVIFYADNRVLHRISGNNALVHPGRLYLSHWSNGNPQWSGGPPIEDTLMTVAYVKAYFNTSLPTKESEWENNCLTLHRAACPVPEIMSDNTSASTWFFTHQSTAVRTRAFQQWSWPILLPIFVACGLLLDL